MLRFEAASPSVRVHLDRAYVRSGAGESAIYELRGAWIERDGGCQAITDPGQLGYVNSHHNFADRATATANAVTYTVALDFEVAVPTWAPKLSARQVSAAVDLLDPLALVTTGGPIDLNVVPSSLPVWVNELSPLNTTGWKDSAAEIEPWIELFNPSSADVDLSGWGLSNDPAQRHRWTFPAGTTLGRHAFLVVAADGQPSQGPLHTSFRLAPAGQIVLTTPKGVSAGERPYPEGVTNGSLQWNATSDRFEPVVTATPGSDT